MIKQYSLDELSLSPEEQTLLNKVCRKIMYLATLKENEKITRIIIGLNSDDSTGYCGVEIATMPQEQIYGFWLLKNGVSLAKILIANVFNKKECLFFQKESISNLFDLAVRGLSEKDILQGRNGVGPKGLKRMKEALAKRGFKIRDLGGIEKI